MLHCKEIFISSNDDVICHVTTHHFRHFTGMGLFPNFWRIQQSNFKFAISKNPRPSQCFFFLFCFHGLVLSWWAGEFACWHSDTGHSCTLTFHGPLCPRFHMLDRSPCLNTSTCLYWVIVPPTDNRMSALCYSDHLCVVYKWYIATWCITNVFSSPYTIYNKSF